MNKKPRRPLTQREIKQAKKASKEIKKVVIVNRSKKQTVPIQLKAPKGMDFFVGEQTVMLYPQRMSTFPKHRLYQEQINNYLKAGRIQMVDSS